MKIEYYRKNVYGRELAYIKDPEIEGVVGRLTGRYTITSQDIESLQKLGHELVEVLPERKK